MFQVLEKVPLEKFQLQKKEAWAMQKLFIKEKKEIYWKNGQVSEIFKTMGTQMSVWKKERWIWYLFKEQSKIIG